MVEVFKTDVTCYEKAKVLVAAIQNHFQNYSANFDLQDCDHIMRIESAFGINTNSLIDFLESLEVKIQILQ